jgi:copper resistance protein C
MVTMLSRRLATVVTLVIVAVFVVVSIAPAFAAAPAVLPLHAKLVSTSPADGSALPSVDVVTMRFSESINPDFVVVEVQGAGGDEADGKATVKGSTVTQRLVGDLAAGEHLVTYRVVSTDGHPVSGRVTFRTTAAPAAPSPSAGVTAAPSPTASASVATPTPSPTGSVVASPQPTVSAAPVSEEGDGGIPPWLVIGAVVLLAALALGAAWRSIGGRQADGGTDAADGADDARAVDPDGTHR